MIYKRRTIESCIKKASTLFKVVALTGMRQVGKSTLLKKISKSRKYVTLDDFEALDTATHMRNVFFKQYETPILIDEIQRAPLLTLEIKKKVDEDEVKGQVWLTGSQRFSMMKQVSESLAGRVANFELLPFSLYELQDKARSSKPFLPSAELKRGTLKCESKETLWHRIWQGAWPELTGMDSEARHWFYNGFLETYLERDIHQTQSVGKLNDFRRFLGVLAGRIGQEFAIGKVASETGIALQTAREWLSIAERSGVVYLLPPFYENIGKTLIKKPKLYFTDSGLAAYLARINSSEELENSYLNGAFFENFVLMEIKKSWVHNGREANFFFYRDLQQREIDLLIKEGATYYPIEIKMTQNPTADMVKSFQVLSGGKLKRGPGALISLTNKMRYLTPDVISLSIYDI